ncbi:MAG TPA: hypothetical protein VGE09_11340 [Pseudoxanthomonas sp.]
MFAIGIVLLIFASLAGHVAPPPLKGWNVRDLFSTVPALLGIVLMVASLVVLAWRWLP